MPTISTDSYDIRIGDASALLSGFLQKSKYSKIFILTDENTRKYCLVKLQYADIERLIVESITPGEVHKTLSTCQHIWSSMLDHRLDRDALCINLGGGVVGDMGGFCAATYKRGIDFVQIPTSLLAQVDASVGGKTGIDFRGAKNIIGAFANPKAVIVDPTFLTTLPPRELLSGWAEVVKHALISDAAYWDELSQLHPHTITDWQPIIERAIRIKSKIVAQDPYEGGLRKILNFGHTIGHAIESYSLAHDDTPMTHGAAVAAGMVAELALSSSVLGLPEAQRDQVSAVLLEWFGKYDIAHATEAIKANLLHDKKNANGNIHFVLLDAIGQAQYDCTATEEQIDAALHYLNHGF